MSECNDIRHLHNTAVHKDKGEDEKEKMMTAEYEMDKNDDEGVPVDTGWAWVVAISVHVMLTLIFGYDRAMSVLFVDFTEEFGQSATVISLMFTVEALSSGISVLFITSKIMAKFSVRTICCVAGISTSMVTILISQAPNIGVFLMLFVFKGVCFQAILVGTLSLIGYYFKKRRALASSVANAGICMAYISIPPITEMLRLEFGTRGCLLLLAGLELHLALFALLLRPPDSYKKMYTNKVSVIEEDINCKLEDTPFLETGKNDNMDKETSPPITTVTLLDRAQVKNIQTMKETQKTGDFLTTNRYDASPHDGDITSKVPTVRIKTDTIHHDVSTEKGSPHTSFHSLNPDPLDLKNKHNSSSSRARSFLNDLQVASGRCNDVNLSPIVSTVIGTQVPPDLISGQDQPASNQCKSISCQSSNNTHHHHNNNNQYCDSPDIEDASPGQGKQICPPSSISLSCSDSSFFPPIDNTHEKGIDNSDADNKKENKMTCVIWLKDIIDFSLFKIWRFRMMTLYIMFAVYVNFLPMYMPAIGYTAGIDKSDAAFLLTISGVTDLVTRIVLGYIGDYPWVSVTKMVALSTLVIGLVSQFTRYIRTYIHFVVFALIVGSSGGVHQNFLNVLLMEYVGVENFTRAFGIIAMVATVSISVTFPVIGAMVDDTGSFVTPLHFTGTMILLVSFLLLFEPIFKRLDEKTPNR